jgi:conserved oligomeric Golgi complex subunit 7
MNGKELMKYVSSVFEDSGELEEDDDEEEHMDAAAKASAAFCNKWLDVVGLAVTGRLLEKVMRIPRLSTKGCEHLSVDLNYLVNVLSALGVPGHPHPLVSHVAELATMESDELQAQIQSRDRNVPAELAVRSIEQRIALIRGIAVN